MRNEIRFDETLLEAIGLSSIEKMGLLFGGNLRGPPDQACGATPLFLPKSFWHVS